MAGAAATFFTACDPARFRAPHQVRGGRRGAHLRRPHLRPDCHEADVRADTRRGAARKRASGAPAATRALRGRFGRSRRDGVLEGVVSADVQDRLHQLEPLRTEALRVASKRLQRADCEDVVSDVMVAVATLPKPIANLKQYFFGALRRRVNDPSRRAKRAQRPLELEERGWRPLAPDEATAQRGIRRAMSGLMDDERTVVEMNLLEGHSLDVVGALLGISRATAHRRLRRALVTLRACNGSGGTETKTRSVRGMSAPLMAAQQRRRFE